MSDCLERERIFFFFWVFDLVVRIEEEEERGVIYIGGVRFENVLNRCVMEGRS